MYKVKFSFFFRFDLSLTKTQCSTKKHMQEHMYRAKLMFSEFDLSLTRIQFQLKNKPRTHVQSQTQFFFFDLN